MLTRRRVIKSLAIATASATVGSQLPRFAWELAAPAEASPFPPRDASIPVGLWMTPRKDSMNQARSDIAGHMTTAPAEVWSMTTGGDVSFARNVKVHGQDAVVLQAGSTLQLAFWNGEIVWRKDKLGVTEVIRIDEFDGSGTTSVFLKTDPRTVILIDLATGEELWRWQSEPSTFIAGYKFQRTPTGLRFYCFPTYSLNGYCFDFSGNSGNPKLLWQTNYSGKYGTGFGPSIILKDMDEDGKLDIVLSGKTPPRGLYQAVIETDTGAIKCDTHYDPDPTSWYPLGRPYGLLQAVPYAKNQLPNILLVSCQVEEYLASTRNEDGKKLSQIWGKFIMKEWPKNDLELRPQITSLADVQGEGSVELVVGLWNGKAWRTLVIDPAQGYAAQRGNLEGYYFWGCYDIDGDGVPEIIVSSESERRTARATTLLAISGKTLRPIAKVANARIFSSTDSPLPDDITYMANRRNPIFLKNDAGIGGILIRKFEGHNESRISFWGGKSGSSIRTYPLAEADCTRADVYDNQLILADGKGGVQRFGEDLKPLGAKLAVRGRTCKPLVCGMVERREMVVDVAGGFLLGGTPDLSHNEKLNHAWKVVGSMPVMHLDRQGRSRLVAFDLSDSEGLLLGKIAVQQVYSPALLVYEMPVVPSRKPFRIPLSDPPYVGLVAYGNDFRVMANMQTGVHTNTQATYDAVGRTRWQDKEHGTHPHVAAAADLYENGEFEVIADDHGELRIYNSVGAVVAYDKGWPPAYTMPIVGKFRSDSKQYILRASGILGMTLVDGNAKTVWQIKTAEAQLWRYFKSLGAIGDTAGNGELTLGVLAEDGVFECIETASGAIRWSLDLKSLPSDTSVVAGDLDGNGKDEFLLGLPDGKLVCISEQAGKGQVLWRKEFDSGVANPIIADVDGDGLAEIIVSTFDGRVRILKEKNFNN